MAVPPNYASLITVIDAILTTYGLSLFQVFGGRSTQPSLRELISLRWKLFSMTTPANYATLIAEIDVVIESYGLSLQEVFGGRSTQPTLQELIDLRYELFEVDGGAGGSADPSQITSETLPTTRADGSALQAGDIWHDSTNSRVWLRNAAGQWISEQIFYLVNVTALTLSFSNSTRLPYICRYTGVIIETCDLKYAAAAPQNETNFWTMSASATTDNGTAASSISFGTVHTTVSANTSGLNELFLKPNIYSIASTTAGVITTIGLSFIKSASAGNLSRLWFALGVRDVY